MADERFTSRFYAAPQKFKSLMVIARYLFMDVAYYRENLSLFYMIFLIIRFGILLSNYKKLPS